MLNITSKSFVNGYSTRNSSIPSIDIKIDLNKHYPVFKLFDFNNIMSQENIIKHNGKGAAVTTIISYYSYLHKDYTKDHVLTFLKQERTISINCCNKYTNIRYIINYLDNIMYPLIYSNNSIYTSTYTMGSNTGFLYLFCVKQEYIYYLKLCILANIEPEFDCFYILAVNNGYERCNCLHSKKIYNSITKSIKKYKIPVVFVESIESEITKIIKLPKFTTIKDYNQWLEGIKTGFLNSVSDNYVQEEMENLPF